MMRFSLPAGTLIGSTHSYASLAEYIIEIGKVQKKLACKPYDGKECSKTVLLLIFFYPERKTYPLQQGIP
jgi:hypothetical protein